ncbi:mucoidy inhibitor MuiA family protein [Engelhardtia mirabilis]|uniref:DUF4139 domain-containing protein n=1 Tax=Engelhardtia mirabilis TaxID=2528011 RepID=A0A518BQU2_9BACT|nr:hypothetical protein Pla133_44290 [Planctomycetes bacterium Pla133]QDV03636.1 hypothetical protein Pla86_44270 [Planctomycetes bacterium Pla86]
MHPSRPAALFLALPLLAPVLAAQDSMEQALQDLIARHQQAAIPQGSTIIPHVTVQDPSEQFGQPRITLLTSTAEVASTIDEVTVYPDSARVRRVAQRPGGATEVFLRGLPAGLDESSLRVRVAQAELVEFELLAEHREALPDARLEQLRAELEALRAEIGDAAGTLDVVRAIDAHLRRELSDGLGGEGGPTGAERVEDWRETLPFLRSELERLGGERRELEGRLDDLRRREAALDRQLGDLGRGGAAVRDLRLELVETMIGGGEIVVEYMVPGARWTPVYDLRSSQALDTVELVYRARVWQSSGEDWSDVAMVLSTAEPRRGAQGPQPAPRWLSLGGDGYDRAFLGQLEGLGYLDAEVAVARMAVPQAEASVESAGLHLRYRLPQRETIESRPEPTTVLVGRRELDVAVERYCVPALDETVWVRGRATNGTGWTLLPGQVGIHVGDEYLGTARLPRVVDGAEFDLALGLDPSLTVERVLLDENLEQPGLFGSKVTRTESWMVRVANASGEPREVLLYEAVPRANDERIEVRFDRTTPAPLTGERFDRLRDEQGVATFRLEVPAGGEAQAHWRLRVAWPKGQGLTGM